MFEGKNSSLRKAYENSVKKSEDIVNNLIIGRRNKK